MCAWTNQLNVIIVPVWFRQKIGLNLRKTLPNKINEFDTHRHTIFGSDIGIVFLEYTKSTDIVEKLCRDKRFYTFLVLATLPMSVCVCVAWRAHWKTNRENVWHYTVLPRNTLAREMTQTHTRTVQNTRICDIPIKYVRRILSLLCMCEFIRKFPICFMFASPSSSQQHYRLQLINKIIYPLNKIFFTHLFTRLIL